MKKNRWCLVYYGDIHKVGCYDRLRDALKGYDDMLKDLISGDMIPEFDEYIIVPERYATTNRIDKYMRRKSLRRITNKMDKIDGKYDKDVEELMKERGWK